MANIINMTLSILYLNMPKNFFYCKVLIMKFVNSDLFDSAVKEVFKMLNL